MSIDAFVRRHTRKHTFSHDYEMLTFLADQLVDCDDPGQMPSNNLGGYGHIVTTVGPLCVTLESANHPGREGSPIIVRFSNPSASIDLEVAWVHGVLLPDVPYTLANVRCVDDSRKYSTWIAFEAFKTNETLYGLPVVSAIKWGVISFCLDCHDPALLLDHDGGRVCCVTYMHGEEAMQRSAHTERYMYAFEEMHAGGHKYTFGTSQKSPVSADDPDAKGFEEEGGSSGPQREYEDGEDGREDDAEQLSDACGSLDLETVGGHTSSLCERKPDLDVGQEQEDITSVL